MFYLGQPHEKMSQTYLRLRQVADYVLENARPGHTAGQVFEMALNKASALGLGGGFMAFPSEHNAPFIGHGPGAGGAFYRSGYGFEAGGYDIAEREGGRFLNPGPREIITLC